MGCEVRKTSAAPTKVAKRDSLHARGGKLHLRLCQARVTMAQWYPELGQHLELLCDIEDDLIDLVGELPHDEAGNGRERLGAISRSALGVCEDIMSNPPEGGWTTAETLWQATAHPDAVDPIESLLLMVRDHLDAILELDPTGATGITASRAAAAFQSAMNLLERRDDAIAQALEDN
jgi:hypothetical protein